MRKGSCIHCSRQGMKTVCALGLNPEAMAKAVTPEGEDYKLGLAYRIPCDSPAMWHNLQKKPMRPDILRILETQHATCDKFTEPTEAQLAAHEQETAQMITNFTRTMPLIEKVKKEYAGMNWEGIDVCPVCKNVIHLTHASNNGHVHGRCETKGCLSWME